MKRRMQMAVLLAGAVLAFGGTHAAGAAPGPFAQVGDGYSDQDVAVGAAYTDFSLGGSCRVVWARRNFKNLVGVWLYRYYQQIRFCWNGRTITYFYRDRFVDVNGLAGFNPWSFDGHVSTNCQYEHCYPGRWGHWSENAFTQGKFHACFTWLCNYRYPAVSITVYGDGSSDSATSG